jgi:hypothetical protein
MALGPLVLFCLNVLSAVVAFLTSYYAYRSDRLANSPLLRVIALGFMLLGVGLLTEAGTSVALGQILVGIAALRTLAVAATLTYLSMQMVAYIIFAVGYGYLAFGKPKKVTAAALLAAGASRIIDLAGLHSFAVMSYFVVLVLLAFIVYQGVLIHSKTRSRFSLLVLLAFILILVAHIFLLVSVVRLAGELFLVGAAVQFLGFVSLLVFLLRSETVGPA